MDRREAKEILSRSQPGEFATDPKLGEALELARRDPQLAEWFAKYRAAQAGSPGEVASPPGTIPDEEHLIPRNRPALAMIGITALALLVIVLASLLRPKPDPFTSYRNRMARLVQRSFPMTSTATNQVQLREYLRANGWPFDFTMPRNLEKLPGKGGAVFTWHGFPVALMGLDAGSNTNLYLFLIRRSAFENVPVERKPEFARIGNLLTATWADADKIYLLAGPNDQSFLQSYLNDLGQ